MDKQKIKTIIVTNPARIPWAKLEEKLVELGAYEHLDIAPYFGGDASPTPFANSDEVEIVGVIWGTTEDTEKVLKAHSNIKWIHSFTAGVDALMTEYIRSHKAPLTRAIGQYSESLGEFISYAMLWFCKSGQKWVDDKASKVYDQSQIKMLSDHTLGIIGFGDIGAQVARCAKLGFRTKVIAMKRNPSSISQEARSYVDEIVGNDQLEYLLSKSDFVVNITPLTPETEGMFNKDFFKKMNKSAIFMNIGRGKSVVEEDLIEALRNKDIAGAYLDVFYTEPLPKESPLWELDNVLMTPHCADMTIDIFDRTVSSFTQNIPLYIEGKDFNSIVDKSAGY